MEMPGPLLGHSLGPGGGQSTPLGCLPTGLLVTSDWLSPEEKQLCLGH